MPTGHTRLRVRGAAYYFRCKIPADLLAHYAPRGEIKFSLKTNDRREAERRVRSEAVYASSISSLRRCGVAGGWSCAPSSDG
jgi:hypothetical protein